MRGFSKRIASLRSIGVGIGLFAAVAIPAGSALASQKQDLSRFTKHGLVIGVANGYIGNNWRTQMINDVRNAAKPYEKAGIVKRVIIANANNNLSQQISQIQNMISEGVDAIIIDAVSPKAVAPAIEDAAAQHILVIGTDNGVVSSKAINVVPDAAAWARTSAKWVFNRMHGKGNLLVVNGLAGQAVNTIRWNAVKGLLDNDYPHIKVLQQVYGKWDEAAAKQAVSSVLSSYDNIRAVWSQDGMAIGTIQAFQSANRKLPIIATDDNLAYLRLWAKLRKQNGFSTVAVDNPPGIAASAFKVAVRMLQGWKLKSNAMDANPLAASQHNTILVKPSLVVTNKNLESVLHANSGKPDSYYLDHVMTSSQVDHLFVKP